MINKSKGLLPDDDFFVDLVYPCTDKFWTKSWNTENKQNCYTKNCRFADTGVRWFLSPRTRKKFAAIFEQASDVQKVENAIHQINLCPPNSVVGYP